MRKLVALSFMTLLVISLTACAGSNVKQAARVKCPACGYEFVPPQ